MNKQLSELIEWMEKESKTVEELNHHNILREGKYVMIQRILSKAKSLQSDDGWISVEDRLPEPYISVLICWSKESKGMHPIMSTARWVGDSWSTDKTKPILPTTITHWQPLPNKPKQDE